MTAQLGVQKSPADPKPAIWRALAQARLAKEQARLTGDTMPAHGVIVASLLHRAFVERIAFACLMSFSIVLMLFVFARNYRLSKQLENPDVILVPSHVTDILRVRANTVPDRIVYDFAESIASDLANISYEDVEERYQELTRYMHPELKVRFQREAREHIDLWKLRKIDQLFSYEKPTAFTRRTEEIHGSDKPVFTVEIWGSVHKYIEGRATEPYGERITLKFTTSAVTSDKPWVFELIDLRRETTQQIEDARLRMAQKGDGR